MKTIVNLLLLLVCGAASGMAASPAAGQPYHLIYLHGAIVENQGLPAVHPRFGEYAFADIVAAFSDSGFVVHATVRSTTTDPWVPARQVAAEIDTLLAAGVSPDHITVVGASLGGFIAGLVSHLAAESELRFVLLGVCSQWAQDWWREHGVQLQGHFLSIHEKSDPGHGSCDQAFSRCAGGLPVIGEVEIDTGRDHGFLYQPLAAWLGPAVQWAHAGGSWGRLGFLVRPLPAVR